MEKWQIENIIRQTLNILEENYSILDLENINIAEISDKISKERI